MPSRPVTDQQVQRYMHYRQQHTQAIAAAKAGMSERTARKFERDPKLPSQRKAPRHWRTRPDPGRAMGRSSHRCSANPGLPVTIFEELQDGCGAERVPDAVRRTLERVCAAGAPGRPRPGVLPSGASAGRMGLSDFTDAAEPVSRSPAGRSTIASIISSRRRHGTREIVLGGESFTALAEGLQNALWRLGGAPSEHRTDSLSAAFRNLAVDQQADLTERYEALCRHYSMRPSRNNRGEAHENGTIEAAHGHLKRRRAGPLAAATGSSLADYRRFMALVVDNTMPAAAPGSCPRLRFGRCPFGAPPTAELTSR
jgi:hypothetical protein